MPEIQLTSTGAEIAGNVRNILADLETLRPFPPIATRILKLCNDEDVEVDQIIRLVECEPSIAGRVLSLANSPLYVASRPISTIGHALVVLGFRSLSQIAVSIAAGQMFDQGSDESAQLRQEIFSHSIGCATVCRLLAKMSNDVDEDEAFLSGVMHDIGKLIHCDATARVESDPTDDPAFLPSSVEDEMAMLGFTHAQTGQQCGTLWGLPQGINMAISNHHLPFDTVDDPLTRLTIVANHLSKVWMLGQHAEGDELEEEIVEAMPQIDMVELEAAARSTFAEVHGIFGN